ncbi:hypothetical protein SCLCIDRAFT_1217112 [Scleroderma citrinum Foug A]|uniref:Uncharacterized protein n=1 Tax=Scleroderma citrinum Foug A TaxID=1036808 RepID=A0A0C3DVA8_9AGAM|nr:hypothetical protein SCLCIDRAFT_1217112 [Scleroderma citrinum Foug A]
MGCRVFLTRLARATYHPGWRLVLFISAHPALRLSHPSFHVLQTTTDESLTPEKGKPVVT